MVLNKKNSGFTLIELVVAMMLMSFIALLAYRMFTDVNAFATLTSRKSDFQMQVEIRFASIFRSIREGQGLLEVSEEEVRWINPGGREMALKYQEIDSLVLVSERPFPFSVSGFELSVTGPKQHVDEWGEPEPLPNGLDSLDFDLDGLISLSELDLDQSGSLDSIECRLIAEIRLKAIVWDRSESLPIEAALFPRRKWKPEIIQQEAKVE